MHTCVIIKSHSSFNCKHLIISALLLASTIFCQRTLITYRHKLVCLCQNSQHSMFILPSRMCVCNLYASMSSQMVSCCLFHFACFNAILHSSAVLLSNCPSQLHPDIFSSRSRIYLDSRSFDVS